MLLGATDGLQVIAEQTSVESWGMFLLGGLRLQLTWSNSFKNYHALVDDAFSESSSN